MSEKGALAYWFDIAPEVREMWLEWYLSDHMPSRVGTVFSAGRCYEAIDASSSHMVLFETPLAEDLLAPSYVALLKPLLQGPNQRANGHFMEMAPSLKIMMHQLFCDG